MRYHTTFGSHPKIEGCFHMAGPQDEDQIMKEIRDILDKPGIKQVIVIFDHGAGERIEVVQKMKE